MQGKLHLILSGCVWCGVTSWDGVREGVRPTPTCGDWRREGPGLVPFVCNCTNGDEGMGHAASPYITSRAGLGWATLFLILAGLGVNVDYSASSCSSLFPWVILVALSCDSTVQTVAKGFASS